MIPEPNEDTIKSAHADLLNRLNEMQTNPYYAPVRLILREAELTILSQERRIDEWVNSDRGQSC